MFSVPKSGDIAFDYGDSPSFYNFDTAKTLSMLDSMVDVALSLLIRDQSSRFELVQVDAHSRARNNPYAALLQKCTVTRKLLAEG